MFSFLISIATFTPLLYYIGELSIFNGAKKEHNTIFVLILILASLAAWIILAVRALNYDPVLLTSFFEVEIGNFKIPICFKIDRIVLFYIFANICVFLHPILVNLFYKNNTSFKWFPAGLSAMTVVILAGNILVLLFSMTLLSLGFLIDDILKPQEVTQNKGAMIFIFQRALDVVIFILMVMMLSKIDPKNIILGRFTLISHEMFLEINEGFWIVAMLLLKSVIQILDVLIFSKNKTIERFFTEINVGFLVLTYIIVRFVFIIDMAAGLNTIVIFGMFPFVTYVGWTLIQEKHLNKILGSYVAGFFLMVIIALIVQSVGMSFYLILVSLVMLTGLYGHLKYVENKTGQTVQDYSGDVAIGPWHSTYLMISFLVMFLPPGCGIIKAITGIMWNQMHSNGMMFIGFFYTLCIQSILVWFFARMFFTQMTSRRDKNIPRESLSYKIILVIYVLLVGTVVLLNLPFDLWFIRKDLFLSWYDKLYFTNHMVTPVNVWFMILWSLFFLLLSMGAYIVYFAKKEEIGLDMKLVQQTKPIREFLKNFYTLFFKKVKSLFLIMVKTLISAGVLIRKQNGAIVTTVGKEIDRQLGLITIFELHTSRQQLGVYLWMLLFMLLAIFIKR